MLYSGSILSALVTLVMIWLCGKALIWMLTEFPDWAAYHIRWSGSHVKQALPFHEPPYRRARRHLRARARKPTHACHRAHKPVLSYCPSPRPRTTAVSDGRRPSTSRSFQPAPRPEPRAVAASGDSRQPDPRRRTDCFFVRARLVALFWTIVVVGLPGAVLQTGASMLVSPGSYLPGRDVSAVVAVAVIIAGAVLLVVGLLFAVTRWRWLIVVDEDGFELRAGFRKPRALSFSDISDVRLASLWPGRSPTVWLFGADGKVIVKVSGASEGYALFCERLRRERPDLMPAADAS